MTDPIEGWWFVAKPAPGAEPVLPNGDGRAVKVGETLKVEGEIKCCERGLHASRRAIDALGYAPGDLICRVRLSGKIDAEPDKLAASERTVLWMADATRALHEFAVWCAREALLRERRAKREPDPRCWKALDVKLAWLDGKATDAKLDAAWAAAGDAAWGAAGGAAWAAAWAAARGAARDAAWAAARDAAWAAARDAAWDAARDADRDAARDADRDAARDAQNKKLESMLKKLPHWKAERVA